MIATAWLEAGAVRLLSLYVFPGPPQRGEAGGAVVLVFNGGIVSGGAIGGGLVVTVRSAVPVGAKCVGLHGLCRMAL